jgi:TPR repeat protein
VEVAEMKCRALLTLFSLCVSSSLLNATQQAPAPTQPAVISVPEKPKWTATDRKRLLAKANSGDPGSQMWLGAAYQQGWFGQTNFKEALKWFRKSAEKGDPDAQNALGQMYQDGEGVKQDYAEAAKWFRLAAEHVLDFGGAGQGRNNLGLLYLNGDGVPKDLVQAYMWFNLTQHQTNLADAKAQMTDAQVVQAEQMATEWTRSHPQR